MPAPSLNSACRKPVTVGGCYNATLVKSSNSNYINIVPAGDKETDVTGVQWTQRANVMRASMLYLRNNPSVLFWQAGNNGVTASTCRR